MPVELPVAPIPAEDPEQKKKKPDDDAPKAGEDKSKLDEELVSRVNQHWLTFITLPVQSEEDQQLKGELEMLVERLQVRHPGVHYRTRAYHLIISGIGHDSLSTCIRDSKDAY